MTPAPDAPVRLHARLDLPAGPVALDVRAGAVVHLDDDAVVAALSGTDGRRHHVRVDGRRVGRGIASRVRRGMAVVSGAPVAAEVSVRDHLVAAAGRRRAAEALEGAPLLAHRGDDPAGVLSGGERRVLAWLRAIAMGPVVVVLDRAAEGLDGDTVAWATRRVDAWSRDGCTVLVRAGRVEEESFGATSN